MINNCSCIIGNSSSSIREGSYLGIPSVNIGDRQQYRETSKNVLHCNLNSNELRKKIIFQINHGKYNKSKLYGEGNAAKKIVDILQKTDINNYKILSYVKERSY